MDSDQGKIFVGGISWETTEEKLKEYFGSFGTVSEAVIMKDRATGRARGFGFVAFSDPEVADRILTHSHSIDGRVVEVKKAVPRDERQAFSKANNGSGPTPGNQNRTKKIFVGGLASSLTEEDFRVYFSQFGNITDVVVMYDPDTQRPRGFGFITFDSEEAVEKVLAQKAFHEIHEKLVEVKRAVPRDPSGGGGGGGGGFTPGRAFNNGYGGQGSIPHESVGNGGGYGGVAGRYHGRGGGGAFPPYGYGPPSYCVPMNGHFGGAGGPGYPPAGATAYGYGNSPASAYVGGGYMGGQPGVGSYMGGPGGYLGAQPVGPRSPWGSSASSPVGYGGNGYWNPPGPGAVVPLTNGTHSGYGYGSNEANQNLGPAAIPSDSASFGVTGRPSQQRAPDARFRPFPVAG